MVNQFEWEMFLSLHRGLFLQISMVVDRQGVFNNGRLISKNIFKVLLDIFKYMAKDKMYFANVSFGYFFSQLLKTLAMLSLLLHVQKCMLHVCVIPLFRVFQHKLERTVVVLCLCLSVHLHAQTTKGEWEERHGKGGINLSPHCSNIKKQPLGAD